MSTVAQRSFAAGEIAPPIYPRCDTVKYATGARTVRNFFVKKHGGVSNRPGTQFICELYDSSRVSRLIPYKHTDALTKVLIMSESRIGSVRTAAETRGATQALSAITNAATGVFTYVGADTFAVGDEVYITGIVGPIGDYINGRQFIVANLDAALNQLMLNYMNGVAVNTTAMGAYTSGGTIAKATQIDLSFNPPQYPNYQEEELFDLQYSQNNELLSLVHPTYPIYEYDGSAFTAPTIGPALLGPFPDGIRGAGGAKTFRYKVTSVSQDTFEESLVGTHELKRIITNGTAANPVVFTTSTNHGFATGDSVYIVKELWISGSIAASYKTVTVLSATTFSVPVNGVGFGGFLAGTDGCYRDVCTVNAAADPTSAAPNVISWVAIAGAREYNVYKERQGLWAYHGSSGSTTYNDEGGNGDANENPPENRDVFGSAGNYPAVVGNIQQRRCFGRTNNDPQTGYASKTVLPNNFTLHFPVIDDDSIKWKLSGEKNALRHVIDLGTIVCLTDAGEWTLHGDPSGILTPAQINPKQVGYNGAAKVKPVLIGNNALYVQARGNIVRDLGFDFQVDGYRGNDLTIFSSHLFEGYTIIDWAYQQSPNSIVWAVRSDGTLLGLTYLKEQDIWAWHRHDTQGGTVESVACVAEGEEDYLYMIVKRTINGATKRYVERMHTRVVDDIVDSVFMDSSKSFDGRHTGTTTMDLSTGGGWTYQDLLTCTASASTFSAADVGKAIFLTGSDGDVIRFTIAGYTNATHVTGYAHKTVPASMQGAIGNGTGSWGLAITVMTGLWHLEGETVSVFGDGFVVGSPNNDAYTTYTVANGKITLERPYMVIHVGIPITADLETLDIDTTQGETVADKKKLITKYTAWFEKTRGVFAGPKPPTDDSVDPLEGLFEMKIREEETQDEPVELFTGTKTDLIRSDWNTNGRVFIRQVDPVPVSVLAIAPSGMIPFRGVGA